MLILVFGLAGCALVANPRFLKAVNLITYKTSAPKSGFWLMSGLFAVTALLLLLTRRYRWAGKALLSLIVLAIGLAAVDVYLRIDPPVEVTVQPHWAKGDMNEWGFLDHEPRPEAARRVLLLGDSIEYGWGDDLTPENRYHDLIEQSLRAEGLDLDLQNTAIPDRQLDFYREQYEKFSPDYDPELVIVGWCFNDINYSEASAQIPGNIERGAEPQLERFRDVIGYPFKKWKLNEWFLWTVLSKRASIPLKEWGWIDGDWIDDHNTQYHAFLASLWNDPRLRKNVSRDLAWLRDDCRENRRKLLVVLFPYRFHVTKQDTTEIDKAKTILDELGIEYVDLYDAYVAGQREGDLYSQRDECHPTARGHQLAADVILPHVRRLLAQPRAEARP